MSKYRFSMTMYNTVGGTQTSTYYEFSRTSYIHVLTLYT